MIVEAHRTCAYDKLLLDVPVHTHYYLLKSNQIKSIVLVLDYVWRNCCKTSILMMNLNSMNGMEGEWPELPAKVVFNLPMPS